MKAQQFLIILVAAVIVGAAAFYGGMQFQKSKAPITGAQSGNGVQSRAGRSGQGRGQNGAAARGQVISTDSNSITVKLQDGSSKIVLINSKTQIGKSQKAAQSDIQNGDMVAAFGNANSDGSVTAQDIQLILKGTLVEPAQAQALRSKRGPRLTDLGVKRITRWNGKTPSGYFLGHLLFT